MLRGVLLAALVLAFALSPSVEAQRGSAGFHGFAGGAGHSAHGGQRGFSNGRSARGWRGGYFSPYFFPYGEPYYDEPGPESVGDEPERRAVYASPEPERTPAAAHVIEIPSAADPRQIKPSAPAMFVLLDGERLEAQRFVLTASSLSVNMGRSERVIPLGAVDLDATTAANRERGINLQIPADRNEILLSF
jgi:hypothetical protein